MAGIQATATMDTVTLTTLYPPVKTDSFIPTPLKISTITATASLSCGSIDADLLYDALVISNTDEGILYVEYGEKYGSQKYKGFHKKLTIARRRKPAARRFDNQVTILVRLVCETENKTEMTNIKVFKNGNVQMTGLKTPAQGYRALNYIINYMKQNPAITDNKDPSITNFQLRLINSDFAIGFEVKRDKLHKTLSKLYPGTFSTYEPCIYPGVKIQFNYNHTHPTSSIDGICKCVNPCNGKGGGCGDGGCKKVTIAIFQSGSVIVTGARSYDQLESAYNYVCKVLAAHADEIKRPPVPVA
jgi:TATA-box binding protein (TBP) (component of TFIID and TFIIIB)